VRALDLDATRYFDFNVKPFHKKLASEHALPGTMLYVTGSWRRLKLRSAKISDRDSVEFSGAPRLLVGQCADIPCHLYRRQLRRRDSDLI
jgi:hypothetical protein